MFATAKGNVRRNSMDAFANIPSNGKFAMRFEEGSEDRLIGVALLEAGDDVLLASRAGQGDPLRRRRRPRVPVSRTSTGVRGMTPASGDDEVVSLSILHRVGVQDQEERDDYLRFAPWKAEKEGEPQMRAERFAELAEKEQFILTVCANGYGKLSLGLRVPPHRPRRPGHHQHRQHRAATARSWPASPRPRPTS